MRAACVSSTEIGRPLQGPDPAFDRPTSTAGNGGTDPGTQPDHCGMGQLLQEGPRPRALQPAGPVDCEAAVVAPLQAVEVSGMENAAEQETIHRNGACQPCPKDSFDRCAPRAQLGESWMREIRTSSLSGGRRPAHGQPSAPPPTRHRRERGTTPRDPEEGRGAPG